MPYYKVVSRDLKSTGGDIDERLVVQYVKDEWVKSNIPQAPLFVFTDKESAIAYGQEYVDDYRLFECDVKPSKRNWGMYGRLYIDEILKKIKQKKRYSHYTYENDDPKIMFADEVQLGNEVLDFPNRTFYKVVSHNLRSAITIAEWHNIAVQYGVGITTRSKIERAPLMVFNSLSAAKDFARMIRSNSGSCKVFSCKVQISKHPWLITDTYTLDEILDLIRFYKSPNIDLDLFRRNNKYINDTTFADPVTLVKEIE